MSSLRPTVFMVILSLAFAFGTLWIISKISPNGRIAAYDQKIGSFIWKALTVIWTVFWKTLLALALIAICSAAIAVILLGFVALGLYARNGEVNLLGSTWEELVGAGLSGLVLCVVGVIALFLLLCGIFLPNSSGGSSGGGGGSYQGHISERHGAPRGWED